MSTSLPPDLETFVQHEVESGNCPSPEEVVSEGLRLLRERKLYELRRDIDAGLAQIKRGEGIELKDDQALDEFFEDLKRRGRERLQASQRRP
jgi:putative addiction module CopG family antidote